MRGLRPHHLRALPRSRAFSTPGSFNPPPPVTSDVSLNPAPGPHDHKIPRLANKPLPPLNLRDLLRFGRPPLPPTALLASARFTRESLPIRLSRRILALRNLPFIIVSNPHVSTIYNNYRRSLDTILSFPRGHPTTLEEELHFTGLLTDLVNTHSNTIPTLARGFLECARYTTPSDVSAFLDEHLKERIGTRLLAEQHIALHLASRGAHGGKTALTDPPDIPDSYIGTIDTALQPARVVQSCAHFVGDICEFKYGVRPEVRIDGDPDVRFPYIPVHLEYILTELLKNAFRATVESSLSAGADMQPVRVTIAKSPSEESISLRIRDRGGGISPEDSANIWSYSFSTFGREEEDEEAAPEMGVMGRFNESVAGEGGSSIAGLGYGLPLSRAYAEYFGGGIEVRSAYGWGTDVYLKLKGVAIEGL